MARTTRQHHRPPDDDTLAVPADGSEWPAPPVGLPSGTTVALKSWGLPSRIDLLSARVAGAG